jgi:hypothetical protein
VLSPGAIQLYLYLFVKLGQDVLGMGQQFHYPPKEVIQGLGFESDKNILSEFS